MQSCCCRMDTATAFNPSLNDSCRKAEKADGYVNCSYGALTPSPSARRYGDAPLGANGTTYCTTRPGYPSSHWLYTSNSCGYVNRSYGVFSPSPNVYSFGDAPIGESLNATTCCTTRPGYPISQWLYTSNSCGRLLQTRAPHDYPTSISLQHSPIVSYGDAPTYDMLHQMGALYITPMTSYPLSYSSGPSELSDSTGPNSPVDSVDSYIGQMLGKNPEDSFASADSGAAAPIVRRFCCTCPNCINDKEVTNLDGTPKKKRHVCHFIGCGKSYAKVTSLRHHLMGHRGEKPFACMWLFCGKRFVRFHELQRHLRTHTGERSYVCSECHERFMRSDHLTNHMRKHKKMRNEKQNGERSGENSVESKEGSCSDPLCHETGADL